MTIIFGTIEICTMIRLGQRLNLVAYETARVSVVPSAMQEDVDQQCELLCDENRLQGVTVSIDPPEFWDTDSEAWHRVTVRAPFGANSLLGWLMPQVWLEESVSIQRQ